ncbi:DUF2254 family protein [Halogranum rubrum]|nr:DUF2254 family protein [Halogranum salarium]
MGFTCLWGGNVLSVQILTTLATTQAGLLAIVFSVTILGVQLVTTRYSPRLVTLFVESPLLKVTFAVLIGSIGFDIALLYFQSSFQTWMLDALTLSAGGVALGAALTLYAFIREAMTRSTPEGTLRAFRHHMTVNRFHDELKAYTEHEFTVYPLHPLYSLTISAIDEGQMVTAKNGIAALERHCESVIEEAANGRWESLSYDERREFLKLVLHDYLPDIAVKADKENDHSVTSEAIELQRSLGEHTLTIPDCDTPCLAVRGMAYTLQDAPIEEGHHSTSNIVWNQIGELYLSICEADQPEAAARAARACEQCLPRAVYRYDETLNLSHGLSNFFRDLDRVHEALFDRYADSLSSVDLDWRNENLPDGAEDYEPLNALRTHLRLMVSLQSTCLTYRLQKDADPVRSSALRSLWKKASIRAAETGQSNYAIAHCQAFIVATVILHISDCDSTNHHTHVLAEISVEAETNIVEAAFDDLLSYDYQSEGRLAVGDEDWEAHNKKFVPIQLGVENFSPINTRPEYTETLLELRQRTREYVTLLEE